MGAYSDNKNDAPKIQSQMRGHSDGKGDALILQPQMGASFDDKSNALILPLQIRACLPSSTSAWKSSPKTAKRLRLNWTQTAQDWKFPRLMKTVTVVQS